MLQNNKASLAFVINVHQRLVADACHTPYRAWCEYVHSNPFTLEEKWERILSWKIIPQDYDNPSIFASDWQLFKLLSKLSFGGTPTERDKLVGYQKFQDAESVCGAHNLFMTTGTTPAFNALRHYSSKIVSQVCGDVSSFFAYVESLPLAQVNHLWKLSVKDVNFRREVGFPPSVMPKFGPGVGVGKKLSKLAGPTEKLLLGTVTPDCAYIGNWLSRKFAIPVPTLAQGSVLTFVVKRVGEARTICYEPSMNMLVQKLIGLYFKHRLKAVLGIDLRDQTRNANLARLGSLCDSYATEDMSSASDLWSFQFVMDQLPRGWFKLLDDSRSKFYFDPITKSWNEFEKFSTMGNGFTFELETLLFYAVVKAAIWYFDRTYLSKDELSVYGDDIIFPKAHARTVEQALRLCGHRPNHEKSYHEGPFRESCGGDFFKGWNVTPLKIEEFDIENGRHSINLYNRLAALDRGIATCSSVQLRTGRALDFIERRLLRNFPKLSSGPDEFTINAVGWQVFTSSDRWLCDGGTRHNVWSQDHQLIVPKWVCQERVEPVTDYHAHPNSVGYFVQFGVAIRNLYRNPDGSLSKDPVPKTVFVRNPALCRPVKVGTSPTQPKAQ